MARYSSSRQKACQPCSSAKAKCDRRAERCSRCTSRGLECNYASAKSPLGRAGTAEAVTTPKESPWPPSPLSSNLSRGLQISSPAGTVTADTIVDASPFMAVRTSDTTFASTAGTARDDHGATNPLDNIQRREGALNYSCTDLICPIDPDSIQTRWLNSLVSTPGQVLKTMPSNVTTFMSRILQSYAAVAIRGRSFPPFVHFSQVTGAASAAPLSTCLSLVRILQKPFPGSEGVAATVLQDEMNKLYAAHGTYDNLTILAAFQAYLIYALVLYFFLGQDTVSLLQQIVINLQDMACSCARQGLVCSAEQQRTRPPWESWIVAEAKRRTLYTMYFFDNMLSVKDGLPTFLGTELRGLPAGGNKHLWRAETRVEWEKEYNTYVAEWPGGGLNIDELWPHPPELDELELDQRRKRIDQWLEDVDEFGSVMYTVTCCTHGK